ncbi:MAG: phage tail tube protein, partial [Dehalococcoidales bacterium]|nr:phage tail tube protein [Dehalococcoidales bacterium]
AEVTKIGGVELTAPKEDTTSADSLNGFTEFLPSLIDPGDVPIEFILRPDDAAQVALETDMIARTSRTAVISIPLSTMTWTFTAYITKFKAADIDAKGVIRGSATLSILGKPVLGITASADITTLTGIEENAGAALTFVPAFAGASYTYNVLVNTASTWIKLTVTDATAVITATAYDAAGTILWGPSTLTTAVQSGAITLDAADSVTRVVVKVVDAGKSAKNYTIYIARP